MHRPEPASPSRQAEPRSPHDGRPHGMSASYGWADLAGYCRAWMTSRERSPVAAPLLTREHQRRVEHGGWTEPLQ